MSVASRPKNMRVITMNSMMVLSDCVSTKETDDDPEKPQATRQDHEKEVKQQVEKPIPFDVVVTNVVVLHSSCLSRATKKLRVDGHYC